MCNRYHSPDEGYIQQYWWLNPGSWAWVPAMCSHDHPVDSSGAPQTTLATAKSLPWGDGA
jgi:hypothetical protein